MVCCCLSIFIYTVLGMLLRRIKYTLMDEVSIVMEKLFLAGDVWGWI